MPGGIDADRVALTGIYRKMDTKGFGQKRAVTAQADDKGIAGNLPLNGAHRRNAPLIMVKTRDRGAKFENCATFDAFFCQKAGEFLRIPAFIVGCIAAADDAGLAVTQGWFNLVTFFGTDHAPVQTKVTHLRGGCLNRG